MGNEIPVSQSALDWALTPWSSLWFNLVPPHAMAKALWDSIPNLCMHLTVSLGMKPQFCTVFLIPSADQIPLSFPHPSLVVYQSCFFPQEGTSLSVSFSLKVNRIGTTLWKHLKLNLLQDSHHQPPQVAHICSWEIVSLSFLYRPALEKPACSGWKSFASPYTWGWLTALSCYFWVGVNLRWCRETSNRQSLQTVP